MAAESESDRRSFILEEDFGEVVSVRGQSLTGIFDNNFVDVFNDVEGTSPALQCRSSDVERLSIVKDDVLTINNVMWRVRKIDDDGTGMAVLRLRK